MPDVVPSDTARDDSIFTLRVIDIGNNLIPADGGATVGRAVSQQTTLDSCYVGSRGDRVKIPLHDSNVTELDFSSCQFAPWELHVIAGALSTLPALKCLQLTSSGDSTGANFQIDKAYTLNAEDTVLDLSGDGGVGKCLGTADVTLLGVWISRNMELPTVLQTLTTLILDGNSFVGAAWAPDENIEVFDALLRCLRLSALETLGLANVGLGMESAHLLIAELTHPMYLPQLSVLDLSRNPLAESIPLARQQIEELDEQQPLPKILLDESVRSQYVLE